MAMTIERKVQSMHHEQYPPQDCKQEISQQKTCKGYCFWSLDMHFLVVQIAVTRDASLISTSSSMILFVQI